MLPYIDGDLDQADPAVATARIAHELRRFRPDVVVTFGPDGAYGHPDHIAISQLTTAAVIEAAACDGDGYPPHRTRKLYYMMLDHELGHVWNRYFGPIVMPVDGVDRTPMEWPDWAITTDVDATEHWQTVWQAVACHQTQLPNYHVLAALPAETHQVLWGRQTFYRVFSAVNGGRAVERDLFDGLT
jgi:LmbE family N-acetylglucosaminyl deacetylase